MLKLAVIGKDVSKSSSPSIHGFLLKRMGEACTYDKISLSEAEFPDRIEALFSQYDGLNVTIPHKRNILPYLNRLEGDAEVFGAVNTVVTKTKAGYNTDGAGFMAMLEGENISVKGKKALVLGVGGAGRSCIFALAGTGAETFAYERDGERLKAVYREFNGFTPCNAVTEQGFQLIVNCTGIGMHDTVGETPVVPDGTGRDALKALIAGSEAAIDLIYEPKESAFLHLAKRHAKRTVNGGAMLFYQAYLADCIFLNRAPDMGDAQKFWEEYREANK